MKDNKNLEGKLRAIQELKRANYVGTQEAWNYVKMMANLYDSPVRVSDEINKRLESQGAVFYRATPERVIGACNFASVFRDELEEEIISDETIEEKSKIEISAQLGGCPYSAYMMAILDEGSKSNEIADIEENLIQDFHAILLAVQKERASDEIFVKHFIERYLEHLGVESYRMKKEIDELILDTPLWDHFFSREHLRQFERDYSRSLFGQTMQLSNKVQRIDRDQVGHRLERRREVLTDFLNDGGFSDYEEAVGSAKSGLMNSRRRLKTYEKYNPLDVVVDNEKRIARKNEFLLMALAPERNFVTKFLAN